MLDLAIATYDPEMDLDDALQTNTWVARVKTKHQEDYGNPILIFVLSMLAEYAIKMLIEWLKERRNNRDAMARMRNAKTSPEV